MYGHSEFLKFYLQYVPLLFKIYRSDVTMGRARKVAKVSQGAIPSSVPKISQDDLEKKITLLIQVEEAYKLEKAKLLAKNKLVLEVWDRLFALCVDSDDPIEEYTIYTDRIKSVLFNGADLSFYYDLCLTSLPS